MSGYFLKDPSSELELSIDWRAGYLTRHEVVCDDLGWSVRPVDDSADDLRVALQEVCDETSKATLAGGVPGQVYMVSSRIKTTKGRELERSLILRVSERKFQ